MLKKGVALLLGLILIVSIASFGTAEEITAEKAVAERMAATDFTIGRIVTFGAYEQDNDKDNGEEPIEWIVLDVQDDQALLLSRYCLDAQAYNTYTKKITWCRCSLRQWLDFNFFKKAFIVQERNRILTTVVVNSKTEAYAYSYGCDDSQDTVFLLSYDEVLAYLPHEEDRAAEATAYAAANGAYVDEETGYAWWWLRSPGVDNTNACGVRADGRISGYGSREVNRQSGGIRPAIWVNTGELTGE